MTTIIGVDFSGAKAENKTWIAQGILEAGALTLNAVYPITRDDLRKLLAGIAPPACVAMDFPFGVPGEFATYISHGRPLRDMRDLWDTIGAMGGFETFGGLRDAFVPFRGELKRVWDQVHHPQSQSPLHKGSPSMIQMTYHGIKLLHDLHQVPGKLWQVPPVDLGNPNHDAVTLLEVMPGAALKDRDLPHQNYKTNFGPKALMNLENRKEIIANLSLNFGIDLPNLQDYRDLFIFNDDALDASIASIIAALWVKDPTSFHLPEKHAATVLSSAQKEGCIYSP